MTTEKYPMDFETLTKGSRLSSKEVEGILGVSANESVKYFHALMGLKSAIEHWMHDNRGEIVTITTRDNGLQVLTDIEASDYGSKRFEAQLRGLQRSHIRHMGVDTSEFSEVQKSKHMREVLVNSHTLQGAMSERARLTLLPHERRTPQQLA